MTSARAAAGRDLKSERQRASSGFCGDAGWSSGVCPVIR